MKWNISQETTLHIRASIRHYEGLPSPSGRNASFDPGPHFGGNDNRQHWKEIRREQRRQKREENKRRR